MSFFQHAVVEPNMFPDNLKQLILNADVTVPVSSSLVTMCGLPSEDNLSNFVKEFLIYKLSQCDEKLQEPERDSGFAFQELAAVKTSHGWNWHPFTKQYGYMSCFLSALERDKTIKKFDVRRYKQSVFDSDVLDDCFYDVYRLLSSLYQDKSKFAQKMIEEAQSDARLSFMNMWNISFNRSILHFLNLLRGYLRFNFPVLILNLPESGDLQLEGEHVRVPEPFLQQYTRMQHILQFSHLARSVESEGSSTQAEECNDFCKIVALVKPEFEPSATATATAIDKLGGKFAKGARKFGVSELLSV